jgi:hypothetical protein
LLGVCDGGGPAPSSSHCDRHRGNRRLMMHPAHPSRDVEERVVYTTTGVIQTGTGDEDVLNLNVARLKRNRRMIAETIVQQSKKLDATAMRQQLAHWEGRDANGRPEYAGVAIYFLKKRLSVLEDKSQRTRGTRER